MHTETALLSLIRAGIRDNVLNEKIKDKLSEDQLEKIYLISMRHDIAHVIAAALAKNGLLGEDDASKKFKNDMMKAVYRDSQRQYAYEQLTSILEQEKILYLPLKGMIISNYYPETWLRTSCDIDILAQDKDIDNAICLLIEKGFKYEKYSAAHHSLFSSGNVHIELHVTLKQRDLSVSDMVLQKAWDYAFPIHSGSYCCQLTPEFFLVYHLAHMAKHMLHGGCGIRPLVDLWLIEKNNSYDEAELYKLLTETGLEEFYRISSKLSSVWMEGLEHTETTRLLADYILDGGTYGTVDNSYKMQAAQGVSKWKSFLRLAFLPKKKLQVIYPNLKKNPWMYPFYCIRRCGRIFNRSKRAKAMRMIYARNSVSDADVGKVRELLRQLGLSDD